MVNAPDLGSDAFGLRGSSPLLRTSYYETKRKIKKENERPLHLQGSFCYASFVRKKNYDRKRKFAAHKMVSSRVMRKIVCRLSG